MDFYSTDYDYYITEADDEVDTGGAGTKPETDPNAAPTADGGGEKDPNAAEPPAAEDPNAGEEVDTGDSGTGEETDPNANEDDPADDAEDPNEDNDFSIGADMEDDGGGGEEGGGSEEGEADPNTEDTEEEEEDSGGGSLDGGVYDSLSPQEKKLKVRALRQLYADLYGSCGAIIDKLNDIVMDDADLNSQIKQAASMLFNLKQMIVDYLLNIFDSKSYIENDIMYNQYLNALNTVKDITSILNKSNEDTEEEDI